MNSDGFCSRHGKRNVRREDVAPAPTHLTSVAIYLLPYICRNIIRGWREQLVHALSQKKPITGDILGIRNKIKACNL
jgi:hypothetical protein